ncbi:MAG: 5'-3' exonuclease H3TH domain-containing protein [bacterium]
MSKLLLVDGSALLHRAYHAYPPLTTKTGEVVGAVYGVVSMLISALEQEQPTSVVVAWDLPKPTFRHVRYVGYKAQRPKADLELVEQIPLVKRAIEKMGLTQVEQEGFEADDIIGTLSKQGDKFFKKDKLEEVIILTGDQDTMQLVSESVRVLTPAKGGNGAKLYGPEEVIEKYGVRPDQIVDYKALIGDSSDNIPGVAGIGPVTAGKLIREYESLEGVYKAIDSGKFEEQFKGEVKRKLVEGKESALLSQELSLIETEMKLKVRPVEWEYQGLESEELRQELEELGFKSLVRRVWGVREEPKAENTNQMGLF